MIMQTLFLLLQWIATIEGQSINLQLQCSLLRTAKECLSTTDELAHPNSTDYCPTTFHAYFCSPETKYGDQAVIKCPFYLLSLIDYRFPEHHFRGYEEIQEDFALVRTNHTCGQEGKPYPYWGKFDRDPCADAVEEHGDVYMNQCICELNLKRLGCLNPDCSIHSYNGTDSTEEDPEKAFDIRMLQYARMIMISGYAVSLVATTLGSILMIGLRRLRCIRIWIHINLQISFLLRAASWLLHDVYSRVDTSLSSDSNFELNSKMENYFAANNLTINTNDTFTEVTQYLMNTWLNPGQKRYSDSYDDFAEVYTVFCEDETGWFWCRLYDVVGHYILCTNYFWVLVEGIYLRMLLQRVGGFSNGKMSVFLAIGWGMAVIPTFIWFVVNLVLRNDVNCWANNEDLAKSTVNSFGQTYGYELITEIPIMVSVLINVFIFISVVSIVGSKLRVNVMKKSDYRYRLARSTLALLPLLGIHYAMTMFIKVGAAESNRKLHMVTNFINVTLTSIQGLLVSIIYCFCNAEVQDELEKTYSAWKLGRDVRDDANRRRSTLSNSQSGGNFWPNSRRRSSMFMNRASFSFGGPARRSTEATYLPSESLLSAGRSASIAGPGAMSTSTMRRIKQMFNSDQRGNIGPPRSSLLSVPNTYDEDSSVLSAPFSQSNSTLNGNPPTTTPSQPPGFPHPTVSIMSGIAEENGEESDEKRREGVVVRPSVPSMPEVRQQSENDDSGYDEKSTLGNSKP